ncbi:hypothetical protein Tco_1213652 [Tanacetum coccineum]
MKKVEPSSRSKAIEDIISIESFVEALVLNHYVLVRKILLAQYEDEGWNDALIPDEVSLNYENPDIEQLLGIKERKVDTLMKDAISLMGKSESVLWLTANKMYRPPSEPSRQEEF